MKLTAADLQGGCFTVTNLGSFGIDSFTPIINAPQCAILGIGRIARRPAVIGDAIVPRDHVTLSLTFDHRIVDGAPAAPQERGARTYGPTATPAGSVARSGAFGRTRQAA